MHKGGRAPSHQAFLQPRSSPGGQRAVCWTTAFIVQKLRRRRDARQRRFISNRFAETSIIISASIDFSQHSIGRLGSYRKALSPLRCLQKCRC